MGSDRKVPIVIRHPVQYCNLTLQVAQIQVSETEYKCSEAVSWSRQLDQ